MRLLLDTHVLLWVLSNDPKLSEKGRKLIENQENEIYYSILSLWEVEIKHLAHSAAMPLTARELSKYCEMSGFQRVLLREQHIFSLADLNREEHASVHKDPFDKILVCQAMTENMLFVTHDRRIADYTEPCIMLI